MSHFVVINKETLDKQIVNTEHLVAQPGTIIHAKFVREDVLEFIQEGNHLIIKLKNGEVIQIENYFVENPEGQDTDLVLDDNVCNFVKLNFKDGIAGFEELTGLEVLLPNAPSNFLTALPWIAGGAAIIGGTIAIAEHDSSKDAPPEAPIVTIDPVVPDVGDQTTLTGTVDNPNADVTVNVGGEDYPVIINPEPNEEGTYDWTVDVPTADLPPNGKIPTEATVTDPETGLTSKPGKDEAPQAPKPPVVTIDPVIPSDEEKTTVTGTVDNPNADVTVNVGGQDVPVKVNPEPNEEGTYDWTVEVPTADLPPNGKIPTEATLTDPETGLTSKPGKDEAPQPPKAPVVTIDPVIPSDEEKTTVTGTVDNPNADVIVNVGGQDIPVKVNPEPNEEGTYDWTVEVPTADLPLNGKIPTEAMVTDPETGLTSKPGKDEAPLSPKGTITVEVDTDGAITGTTTDVEPGEPVVLTITGQDKNGAPVEATVETTVNTDGSYTAQVPTEFADGELTVVATTEDRNGTVISDTDDLLKTDTDQDPATPEQGGLDRTPGTITVDVDTKGQITGQTTDVEPNSTVTLTITGQDKNGAPVEATVNHSQYRWQLYSTSTY
ncbi:BapA/Bap/LapF family prefix-like domain-containing protein [Acinetobacter lanii]|uniref:BapA prefix-like domain-containing protein n=1 Tax=Acinetobacter lanii TaxID=2715163 RepID=A0A6G8S531_9GAMM|nr:BapA prefix-like domain-containing protein [Acinetobacter lanii]